MRELAPPALAPDQRVHVWGKTGRTFTGRWALAMALRAKDFALARRALNESTRFERKYGGSSHRTRVIQVQEYIKRVKDVPCMDCGQRYPAPVMDFDHVRGKKSFTMSVAVKMGVALYRIRAERAKCDVVCANCHRLREMRKRRVSTR